MPFDLLFVPEKWLHKGPRTEKFWRKEIVYSTFLPDKRPKCRNTIQDLTVGIETVPGILARILDIKACENKCRREEDERGCEFDPRSFPSDCPF